MSVASNEDGKKWIQTSVALVCILMVYVLISFFEKMADWFALETTIPYFYGVSQFVSVITGLTTYIFIFKNQKSNDFLTNVYHEVVKVVWPDRQQTWIHTLVIMIAVTIMGFVFYFFDFGANFLLGLVNK
jgi:preprotein translocase subunit SecE